MIIGGIQKTTLIDFPGMLATTVFTQGCPLRCGYCHNPELVVPEQYATPLVEDEVFAFLATRIDKIQGVCVTGGEPTMHHDIRPFLARIKALGYKVKLDTNGTYPEVLETILCDGHVDYVAMDIKGPLSRYEIIVGGRHVMHSVQRSITLLMNAGIAYEFRTTVVWPLLEIDDFDQIGQLIQAAPRYFLQNYVNAGKQVSGESELRSFTQQELLQAQSIMQRYVEYVEIR